MDPIEASRQDTLDHIQKVQTGLDEVVAELKARANKKVQTGLDEVVAELKARANKHDLSKLQEPELSGFAHAKQRLAGAVYGSPEYQALLDESRPIIEEHYRANSHHPEHYPDGIAGMSLLDVVEMFCDWKAAGERTKDGSLEQSLRVNVARFKIEPQLAQILYNTAREMGWK